MSTTIAKNLKKTSVEIDKFGNIISEVTPEMDALEEKKKARARRLGFR